jgi:hypothetical protein
VSSCDVDVDVVVVDVVVDVVVVVDDCRCPRAHHTMPSTKSRKGVSRSVRLARVGPGSSVVEILNLTAMARRRQQEQEDIDHGIRGMSTPYSCPSRR